jgi:hypothetical protein
VAAEPKFRTRSPKTSGQSFIKHGLTARWEQVSLRVPRDCDPPPKEYGFEYHFHLIVEEIFVNHSASAGLP